MITRACLRTSLSFTFAVTLLGCGSSKELPPTIDLAFIPKTSNNLVFTMGNNGAQYGARDLSNSRGHQITVEYMASPELDPSAEQALVQQAVAEKKNGILISCIDDSITTSINDAVNAGIPVITYDSDCPDSKRLGFYSMQNDVTGAKTADLLASVMGAGTKTVAILTGHAGSENLELRVSGFLERLSSTYPDITVVTTVNCGETADDCGAAVESQIISQYPDLDGLFVVGLWGLQAGCSCSDTGMTCTCDDTQMPNWKAAAKGTLKTVAYDSLPFELTLMKQGYVSALIGQKYFGWGYDTVSLMVDHLTTGSQVSAFIDSGFDVVCPNNVDEMQSKWDSADFRTPLTANCSP